MALDEKAYTVTKMIQELKRHTKELFEAFRYLLMGLLLLCALVLFVLSPLLAAILLVITLIAKAVYDFSKRPLDPIDFD